MVSLLSVKAQKRLTIPECASMKQLALVDFINGRRPEMKQN
jgi:hypothetical protein